MLTRPSGEILLSDSSVGSVYVLVDKVFLGSHSRRRRRSFS